MLVNGTVQLAVKLIQELRTAKDGAFVRTLDVASKKGWDGNYLLKVVTNLQRAGIVETKRGPAGGARIKAKTINLHDVWNAIDPSLQINPDVQVFKQPLNKFRTALKEISV